MEIVELGSKKHKEKNCSENSRKNKQRVNQKSSIYLQPKVEKGRQTRQNCEKVGGKNKPKRNEKSPFSSLIDLSKSDSYRTIGSLMLLIR